MHDESGGTLLEEFILYLEQTFGEMCAVSGHTFRTRYVVYGVNFVKACVVCIAGHRHRGN